MNYLIFLFTVPPETTTIIMLLLQRKKLRLRAISDLPVASPAPVLRTQEARGLACWEPQGGTSLPLWEQTLRRFCIQTH